MPGDLLRGTLRFAYGDAEPDGRAFRELVSALDRIPACFESSGAHG